MSTTKKLEAARAEVERLTAELKTEQIAETEKELSALGWHLDGGVRSGSPYWLANPGDGCANIRADSAERLLAKVHATVLQRNVVRLKVPQPIEPTPVPTADERIAALEEQVAALTDDRPAAA